LGNLSTPKSVQKLQMALHAKAKTEAGYRFYALYDKITRRVDHGANPRPKPDIKARGGPRLQNRSRARARRLGGLVLVVGGCSKLNRFNPVNMGKVAREGPAPCNLC
jgi:hypothetical protein